MPTGILWPEIPSLSSRSFVANRVALAPHTALAGVTSGKTVARDVPRFSARLWIASTRWLLTAVWWLSCEQYGVVWRMMVALLDMSWSLDGSVAGCERVLDVSVSLDVDVVVVVKQ